MAFTTATGENKTETCSRSYLNGTAELTQKIIENYSRFKEQPNFSKGIPTTVTVTLFIYSFDSVNPSDMEFQVNGFLWQEWQDERLAYDQCRFPMNSNFQELSALKYIWGPKLYFVNGKDGRIHQMSSPNLNFEIYPNGHIFYSMRITMTLACSMDFTSYPFDIQKCPIMIESCNFSRLNSEITFKRHNGYFMIQTYFPMALIVIISWSTFWLDPSSVAARTTIGVTTLLALVTLTYSAVLVAPPVSYIKAIDIWIGICTLFVFSAFMEFTVVPDEPNTGNTGSKDAWVPDVEHIRRRVMERTGVRRHGAAETIDVCCRIACPLLFIAFNVIYWTHFLVH
ncbi:Glycine receptor subunit alphaZ1 [Nymphon striatum]|nr:Glycine receptor subunit alphaZ1 [Nymphon striatum]